MSDLDAMYHDKTGKNHRSDDDEESDEDEEEVPSGDEELWEEIEDL